MEEDGNHTYLGGGGLPYMYHSTENLNPPIRVREIQKRFFYTIESFSSSLERYDVTLKMLTKVRNIVVPSEVLVVC